MFGPRVAAVARGEFFLIPTRGNRPCPPPPPIFFVRRLTEHYEISSESSGQKKVIIFLSFMFFFNFCEFDNIIIYIF